MVKVLDPNNPQLREAIQNVVTINFAELVKVYPCVDFHPSSQRLAVGTTDGSTLIYDLRTANKVNVLHQHSGPVHAASLSPQGTLIVTLTLQDSRITFWQPSGGFFDSIKGALTKGNISMVGKSTPYRSFAIGQPNQSIDLQAVLDSVKLRWASERSVELDSIGGLHLTFSV